MQQIDPALLLSPERAHVRLAKLIAWRNLLYANGVSESTVQAELQHAGEGQLPTRHEDLLHSTYITLEAVEAVLINLLASTITVKAADVSDELVLED